MRVLQSLTRLVHSVGANAMRLILCKVGIYMLIDVNSPLIGESIDRTLPWTTYTAAYLNRTFAVVEAFKSYENTLLFFAGNEVINDVASGGVVPPYMRVSPLQSS
jgi:Glucanosyltransferase